MVNRTLPQKQKIDLMTVLAFMIVARFSCAALSNIPIFTMAFTFIYGVAFVGFFFLTVRRITAREMILLATAALYTLFVLGQSLLAQKGLFFTDPFNAYVIVFMVAVYLWSKRQSPSVQRGLIVVIFVGLLFSYCYSIYILSKDPNASRVVASAERSPYDVINAVGGFEEVYGGVNIICILLFAYKAMTDQKRKGKFFVAVLLILATVFTIMASYATALLLLILAITLFFASRNRNISAALIVGMILVLILHEPIGQFMMDISRKITYSDTFRERVYDFGEMFKTFEAAGTYAGEGGRLDRMDYSWDTFLKYPILGGFTRKDGRYGGHSELFDVLAKFGLVGFSLLIIFFANLYRDVRSSLKSEEFKICCGIVFLIYAITSVVNPVLYAGQILPLMLVLPLIPAFVSRGKIDGTEQGKELIS